MSQSMAQDKALSADAPVFVPFQNASIVANNGNHHHHHHHHPTTSKHRRRNYNQSQKSRDRQEDSINDARKDEGTSQAKSNHRNNHRPRQRKANNKRNNNSKNRDTFSHQPRKTQSKTNKRHPKPSKVGQDAKEEKPLYRLESSFPSLGREGTSNTDNSSSSTIWVSRNHKPEIFQPLQSQDECNILNGQEDDDFSPSGLQRLTTNRSKAHSPVVQIQATKHNTASLNERNGIPAANDTSNTEHETKERRAYGFYRQNLKNSRRLKYSMDRLRDKWWDTLARKRRHRNMIVELGMYMKNRIVDPDEDGNVSESSESSIDSHLEPVEISNPNDPTMQDTPKLQSTLYTKLTQSISDESHFDILKDAIERNDEEVLKQFFIMCRNKQLPIDLTRDAETLSEAAIRLCVQQDKPHILRVVLTNKNGTSRNKKKQEIKSLTVTPLMLAAELGHSECLSILLSKEERNSNSISCRDSNGDNVFHYCCRGQGDESTLRALLKQLSSTTSSAKWKQQLLPKLLLTKNGSQKTPMHIACQQGRVELVETFLSICSTAILSKMLSAVDNLEQTPLLAAVAANSIDVVIGLIMWRGNQNVSARKSKIYQQIAPSKVSDRFEKVASPCPLEWSAENGNLEMIMLLLQFSDSSGLSDYRVTGAIPALLRSSALDDTKADGVRVIIQAGGNPFSSSATDSTTPETAISIATKLRSSPQVLRILVQTGKKELQTRQQQRRRDPKLRQQPEAFFQAMEASENLQMEDALKNALVESLFYSWTQKQKPMTSSKHLTSATVLYQEGASLQERDMVRLRASLYTENILVDSLPSAKETEMKRCYVATYRHYNTRYPKSVLKVNDIDRSRLSFSSNLMCQMAWLRDDVDTFGCNCPWLSGANFAARSGEENRQDQVIMIVGDKNEQFVVHGSIVAQKSAKLASAIRFTKMNSTESIPEIYLKFDARLFKLMLQHIYHGSIFCSGWSDSDDEQVCRDILDLILLAEEALCDSMIQECEMRLLSSDPRRCFCWSCCKAVRPCLPDNNNDQDFAECMYCVEGPSLLVSGHAALDVLAICQYLESLEPTYQLHVVPSTLPSLRCMTASKAWFNLSSSGAWASASAIRLLKDSAIQKIFLEFAQVIRSQSFLDSVGLNMREMSQELSDVSMLSQENLLLQTCLEELFQSCLPSTLGRYDDSFRKLGTKSISPYAVLAVDISAF